MAEAGGCQWWRSLFFFAHYLLPLIISSAHPAHTAAARAWQRGSTSHTGRHAPRHQHRTAELGRVSGLPPSRCSLQTGRNPLHVNAINTGVLVHNPADPVSGFQGIPRNMTGVAEKMRTAGYRTAMTGKWDAGMATPQVRPHSSSWRVASPLNREQ